MRFDQLILSEVKERKTPFYLYSSKQLERQVEYLKSHIDPAVKIFYSTKANSHPYLLRQLVQLGLSLDVASLGELNRALETKIGPDRLEFTGPAKSYDEIKLALQSRIGQIVVESMSELGRIEKLALELGIVAPVVLRLNPSQKIWHSGRKVENEWSQFGSDETQIIEIAKRAMGSRNLEFCGFHVHTQSHFLNFEFAIEAHRLALESIERVGRICGIGQLKYVNLGGGLGVAYCLEDEALDLESYGKELNLLLTKSRKNPLFGSCQYQIELGRFIAAPMGYFVTSIVDIKHSYGKKILITDGGFSQAQMACGIGQIVRRNLRMDLVAIDKNLERETVQIAGPSCYSRDLIAVEVNLPKAKIGDLICIHNMGAYGLQFSPNHFLCHEPAEEIYV